MNNTLFEYVFCQNAIKDSVFMSTVLEHYNPKYFDNKDVRRILDVATDFFQRRNVLPSLTEIKMQLKDEEVDGFKNVLREIQTLDKSYDYDELYQITEKYLRERAVFQSILEVSESVTKQNKEIDSENILELFTKSCNIALIDDIGMDYFEKIEQHCLDLTKPNNKITTGFRWLDANLDGGWEAEGRAIYIFTGFTNVGKSIFLGHVALAGVKANKTVLLISLEMSEQMYAKRITSNLSKIGLNELKTNIDELKSRILTFKGEHKDAKLIIKEFPTKSMTISHMNGYINKLIKKGIKPDMIVVDYLNLSKASKSYSGTYDEIKSIAEQMRASTYLFKIPIISASQLGRAAAKKEEPGMEMTSESIGLSFTADAQFSIWTTPELKSAGKIMLGIQKNRFGPNSGCTTINIDWNTLTLSENEEGTIEINGNDMEIVAPSNFTISSDDTLNKFVEEINGK